MANKDLHWLNVANNILNVVPAHQRKQFHGYCLEHNQAAYIQAAAAMDALVKGFDCAVRDGYKVYPTLVKVDKGWLPLEEGL